MSEATQVNDGRRDEPLLDLGRRDDVEYDPASSAQAIDEAELDDDFDGSSPFGPASFIYGEEAGGEDAVGSAPAQAQPGLPALPDLLTLGGLPKLNKLPPMTNLPPNPGSLRTQGEDASKQLPPLPSLPPLPPLPKQE